MRVSTQELNWLIEHPPLNPTAYNLLVRVEEIETETESGLVVMTEKEAGREKLGASMGYIIALGPKAWMALEDGEPWAELGQKVYFDRYAGSVVKIDGLDDGTFRIIRDEEVLATWPK